MSKRKIADIWLTMADVTEKKFACVNIAAIKTDQVMGNKCETCPWAFRSHPIVQGTGVKLCTLDFMKVMGLKFGLEEIA